VTVVRMLAVLPGLLGLLGALLGVTGTAVLGAQSGARPAHVDIAASTRLAHVQSAARPVLQRLLQHRAVAYARGDPAALSDVFVPGSSVLRRDQALMRAWSRRGLAVRGAVVRVRSVQMLDAGPGRRVVRTVDRLGPVRAAWRDRLVMLPRDRLSRHRIVLVRGAGRWRIAAVRGLAG
jgi:hypothetical protein